MNSTRIKWTNHLLAGLPMNVWHTLEDQIESVHLDVGHVLFEPGVEIDHVYFPFTAIVSLMHVLADGESIEVAMVGAEGVLGVSIFMEDNCASHRAVVLRSGYVYRLNAAAAKRAFAESAQTTQIMLQYVQAMISQISKVSACNRHHSLKQQLSRWLLLYLDRTNDMQVQCTQEEISLVLGVRRERIAGAAKVFQDLGILNYSRGNIEITNKALLQHHTCECYAIITTEYRRLRPLALSA